VSVPVGQKAAAERHRDHLIADLARSIAVIPVLLALTLVLAVGHEAGQGHVTLETDTEQARNILEHPRQQLPLLHDLLSTRTKDLLSDPVQDLILDLPRETTKSTTDLIRLKDIRKMIVMKRMTGIEKINLASMKSRRRARSMLISIANMNGTRSRRRNTIERTKNTTIMVLVSHIKQRRTVVTGQDLEIDDGKSLRPLGV